MSYLVEDLVESIKTRSLAPISQTTFDDDKLILMANEELQLKLVSDLVVVREDFFLAEESVSLIQDVANYGLPSRAIGNAIKQVFFVPAGLTTRIPLERVDSDRAQAYDTSSAQPEKFYLLGDEIVLLPTPSQSSGTVLFVYPASPNALTATENCTKITAVASNVFTVDTDLTASLIVGSYVDFVSAKSPFKLWTYRTAITAISSTSITVTLADVINAASTVEPQVGDYICASGNANIPQIPIAYHSVLAQMVVVRLMESLGDINKLNASIATLTAMRSEASKLVRNRVENSPAKVNGRNKIRSFFC